MPDLRARLVIQRFDTCPKQRGGIKVREWLHGFHIVLCRRACMYVFYLSLFSGHSSGLSCTHLFTVVRFLGSTAYMLVRLFAGE